MQKLVRAAFGNNNVDTCARVCHSPTGYGLKTDARRVGRHAGLRLGGARRRDHGDRRQPHRRPPGVRLAAEAPPARGREAHRRRSAHASTWCARRTSQADYHLKLLPGTNVAVINALAHVVVTEGLLKEDFVQARCDLREYEKWKAFISEPRNSPEAMEPITGVPAAEMRGAARLYAGARNAAIYYGLGVTEHSQGSTMVIGIANLAMATGNIGRPGVGVNPLRGQNNVQGSCDMGSFPHELPGYRHVSDAARARAVRVGVERDARAGARAAHPEHVRRRARRHASRACTSRARTSRSPTRTRSTSPPRSAALECLVVQDLFLNETAKFAHVFLPGSSFLEKDGTFTNAERRISPRAQGDAAARGPGGLGGHRGAVRTRSATRCTTDHPSADHGRDRAPDADVHRRELREARPARQHPVAVQRQGARGHAGHARRASSCAARAGSCSPSTSRPTSGRPGSIRCCSPPAASSPSTTSARRRAAPRTRAGTTRTCSRSIRTTPSSAASSDGDWVGIAQPRRRDRAARHASPSACSPAWSTRRSTSRGPAPTWSPPRTPTGPPTAPSTRSRRCRSRRVMQPSEWQKDYERFSQAQDELLEQRERAQA